MKHSIEIFYNKSKIQTRLIPISCLLIFIPIETGNLLFDFFQQPPNQAKGLLPILIVLGTFMLMLYYFLIQMFRIWYKKFTLKKPIFIIDDNGITDKVSFHSVGFIPWSNIKKVSAFTSRKHYLVFFLNDKHELLNKVKSVAKKKKITKAFKKNGDNIRVAVDWLDANVYVIKKLVQAKLDEYNKTQEAMATSPISKIGQ